MKRRKQITITESGYIEPYRTVDTVTKRGLRCDNCNRYDLSNKTCDVVSGKLNDHGVCNIWTNVESCMDWRFVSHEEANIILSRHEKLSKSQAGYMIIPDKYAPKRMGKGTSCGTCKYFSNHGTCALVSGEIWRTGCCNLYSENGTTISQPYISGQQILEKIPDIEDLYKQCDVLLQ